MSVLLILAGIFFLFLAYKLASRNIKFIKNSVSVDGEIVAFNEGESDGTRMFTPVVRYTTKCGKEFEKPSDSSSSHPTQKVGDAMIIRYLPEKPDDPIFGGYTVSWVISVLLLVFGGVLLQVGVMDFLA